MRRAAAPLAAAVLLLLLLTACGSGAGTAAPSASSGASPSGPLRSPPAAIPSAASTTLAVQRGGVPAIAGPSWSVLGVDGTAVTLEWAGAASDACGAVDAAYVTETADEVVIALGAHARAAGRICPLVLVPRSAVVTLTAPLGARRLLEPVRGACGPSVRRDDEAGRTCPVRPASGAATT